MLLFQSAAAAYTLTAAAYTHAATAYTHAAAAYTLAAAAYMRQCENNTSLRPAKLKLGLTLAITNNDSVGCRTCLCNLFQISVIFFILPVISFVKASISDLDFVNFLCFFPGLGGVDGNVEIYVC